MPRVLKHLFAVLVVLIVAGCSGGGCSSCAGCGVTPLPQGFPLERRVENAAALRLTDSGFQFLQDNGATLAGALLGSSMITFDVPPVSQSVLGIDIDLCKNGANPNANPPECIVEIDPALAYLPIKSATEHQIVIQGGKIPVRLQNAVGVADYGIFGTDDFNIVLNGDGSCPGGSYAQIDVTVDISIEIRDNPADPFYGYTQVKLVTVDIDDNQLKSSIHSCGGVTGDVIDFLKDLIFDFIAPSIDQLLVDAIQDQLCLKADPTISPSCPAGSHDEGGTCVLDSDPSQCAPIMLGLNGHIDLSQFLSSLSPGTTGGLDFLLASGGHSPRNDGTPWHWGDLDPVANGATLGFYGGSEPMPVSGCVRLSDLPIPSAIPMPDELLGNTVTNWPSDLAGPHVGLALNERFVNYALNGVYNSGLLCIGVTSELSSLLNSGTLGILAASLKDLGLQREQQQVAIVIRPGNPPTMTFGNGTDIATDPLLRLGLRDASFDFYIWSHDRFIRFMTATFDIDVPLNLDVTPEGLVPVVGELAIDNAKVTNSALLRENPSDLAGSLADLLKGQVGSLLGDAIPPIDLASQLSSLGLTLNIPPTIEGQGSPGLRKLSKAQDNYLGIFATLGVAAAPKVIPAETKLEIVRKLVHPEGLRWGTMTPENAPEIRLYASSPEDDGTRVMEYSYRLDNGLWHPFTTSRWIDIHDGWLRVQGRHQIAVRARERGVVDSLDPTPAIVEIVVDGDSPEIRVGEWSSEGVAVDVNDAVSDVSATQVRVRLDDGVWSDWRPASELGRIDVGEADELSVEARDEEGNVGSVSQAIIRGRASDTGSSGCGCTVAGTPSQDGKVMGLIGIMLLGAAIRLTSKRSSQRSTSSRPPRAPARQPRRLSAHGPLFGLAALVVAATSPGCSCEDETVPTEDPNANAVALNPGLAGSYTSVAVSGSDIWVAGYAEADWFNDFSWGDLIVGKYDGEKVAWVAVDGVPTDPPPDPKLYKASGFRGGQTEPGDDVGLWTSIAIDDAGNPAVAYYDRTNRALKFARSKGDAWEISTVELKTRSDIGRYAKLVFVGATPMIAYLAIEPGDAGAVKSAVRVATGSASGTWGFEDVLVDPATPCRQAFCDSGTSCIVSTGLCQASIDTCGECAADEKCVDVGGTPTCSAFYGASRLDTYPDAVGDYIAAAPDGKGGIGLAFYDRIHGNVMIASKAGGAWTTLLVDGQAADGTDTGDMGVGTTLFIDGQGAWHVAYVDGLAEVLRYARVDGGTTVAVNEVVDDGLTLGGTKFADGQHIVGDDANLVVTPSGEVRIAYQDASQGTLRYAVGTPGATGYAWALSDIDQAGFAGFFPRQVNVDGAYKIANFWRVGGEEVKGDVAIVSP
jgi:hypothetical protein